MIQIAVLLTCFNRKAKTLSCLHTFYEVAQKYNDKVDSESRLQFTVFLTDDGCTDGTADAIKEQFKDKDIHILQGTGSLFWCGGMRFAWQAALESKKKWDYFLLLNDDVEFMDNLFDELFSTNDYCIKQYGMRGIYSGITNSLSDKSKTTYGGNVWTKKFLGKSRRLAPSGKPQMCDVTNANILLVPLEVVDKIGIFYEGYSHGCADYDYAITARKNGIPALITSNFCGSCDDDHGSSDEQANKVLNMTLKERKAYFSNPLHSNVDYLKFIRRNFKIRYPIVWIFRQVNLYCPKLYYGLNKLR